VAGKPVITRSASGKIDKFYAVAVGHKPGVYENWDEAQAQVTDIKGPIYRRFETRLEAEEFVRTKGKSSKVTKTAEGSSTKKRKVTSGSSSKNVIKSRTLQVYTDGSSRGNGKAGAIAGVGVYFGDNDNR
jgi:ribonuclease HI